MRLPAGIDKNLVREVMQVGKHRTQSDAVRAALLSYIERRLPEGQSLELYLVRLQDQSKSPKSK